MQWLSRTDVFLLGVASYLAVMTLVRMMQRRRDQVVADVQRQVEEHRKRSRRTQNDQTRGAA